MIATSIVQSLRLLDAGVPKESADLIAFNAKSMNSVPAWSLSALWQIIHEAGEIYEFSTDIQPEELIETLVTTICSHYAPAPSEQ